MTKDEKEILTGFLIQSITATGYTTQSGEIEFKIDVLERALEVLRYEYKHIENKLPFEEFLSGTVALKNGRLNFIASEKMKDVGTGTAAVRLQPKLLLFLLLYHRNYFKIYDIIDKFVEKSGTNFKSLTSKRLRLVSPGVLRIRASRRQL